MAGDAAGPFADTRDHLRAELLRVDLLLRRHLESWWAEREGDVDEFRGLYVSDAEVDRLLADPGAALAATGHSDRSDRAGSSTGTHRSAGAGAGTGAGRESSTRQSELKRHLDAVTERVEARAVCSRQSGVDLRLATLAARYHLDCNERDALLLALAPDLDRGYEKVYGYLQDDVTRTRPSVGLCLRVLAGDGTETLANRRLFDPDATLRDAGLLSVRPEDAPDLSRTCLVPDRVVRYLLGDDAVATTLPDSTSVVVPREATADGVLRTDSLGLGPDQRTGVDRVASALATPEHGSVLGAFVGPDEAAATATIDALAADAGVRVLRADAADLERAGDDWPVLELGREATLQGGLLHVRNLDALAEDRGGATGPDADAEPVTTGADRIEAFVTALDAVDGHVFVTGDVDLTERLQPALADHGVVTVAFPRPDAARRRELWAAIEGLPADADPETLASTYRLTRGQIADAVTTARAITDGELTLSALHEGCRLHSRHRLDDLAREIDPGYGWDDIVLPADVTAHLREVAAHVRHRGTVFEEWGFEAKYSLGNGINVLFTGPSGTGKTMAAEVIAADVGLPLYKLDLSAVISKYIGETEKNLRRVFDEAEHSNAILFFDEADALFGTRSEVSDSHDRYANVEVDYLLQRMESHDGCAILSSNLEENIDDAFLRRLNLTVDFPYPDRDARAAIWRGVFPEETPVAELDVPYLAEFELAGGDIKNVATTAAFMAAEAGAAVSMAHVVPALRREFQKTDRLFDAEDFGEYGRHLPG